MIETELYTNRHYTLNIITNLAKYLAVFTNQIKRNKVIETMNYDQIKA